MPKHYVCACNCLPTSQQGVACRYKVNLVNQIKCVQYSAKPNAKKNCLLHKLEHDGEGLNLLNNQVTTLTN